MWKDLGIQPTADSKAIRRAYARQLRSLDPDSDPAAFQRLREAFEWAMRGADRPAASVREIPRRMASPVERESVQVSAGQPSVVIAIPADTRGPDLQPHAISTLQPDFRVDDGEVQAILGGCRRALEAGDVEGAFQQLVAASAKGLLPLTDVYGIATEVMTAAVDDRTLPGERFCLMARHLGWNGPTAVRDERNPALREKVSARLEAEAWYARLRATAETKTSWPTFLELQERCLARVALGVAPRWWLCFANAGVKQTLLTSYGRFAPWLDVRIDPQRFDWLKPSLRSNFDNSVASLSWVLVGVPLLPILLLVSLIVGLFPRHSRRDPAGGNPARQWWRRTLQPTDSHLHVRSDLTPLKTLLESIWRIYFFVLVCLLGFVLITITITWW